MGKIILSLDVNDNEMLKKAEEIQKVSSELSSLISDFKYMLEAKASPLDEGETIELLKMRVKELGKKVADLETENQSQPNIEINSNEVAKTVVKSMRDTFPIGEGTQ